MEAEIRTILSNIVNLYNQQIEACGYISKYFNLYYTTKNFDNHIDSYKLQYSHIEKEKNIFIRYSGQQLFKLELGQSQDIMGCHIQFTIKENYVVAQKDRVQDDHDTFVTFVVRYKRLEKIEELSASLLNIFCLRINITKEQMEFANKRAEYDTYQFATFIQDGNIQQCIMQKRYCNVTYPQRVALIDTKQKMIQHIESLEQAVNSENQTEKTFVHIYPLATQTSQNKIVISVPQQQVKDNNKNNKCTPICMEILDNGEDKFYQEFEIQKYINTFDDQTNIQYTFKLVTDKKSANSATDLYLTRKSSKSINKNIIMISPFHSQNSMWNLTNEDAFSWQLYSKVQTGKVVTFHLIQNRPNNNQLFYFCKAQEISQQFEQQQIQLNNSSIQSIDLKDINYNISQQFKILSANGKPIKEQLYNYNAPIIIQSCQNSNYIGHQNKSIIFTNIQCATRFILEGQSNSKKLIKKLANCHIFQNVSKTNRDAMNQVEKEEWKDSQDYYVYSNEKQIDLQNEQQFWFTEFYKKKSELFVVKQDDIVRITIKDEKNENTIIVKENKIHVESQFKYENNYTKNLFKIIKIKTLPLTDIASEYSVSSMLTQESINASSMNTNVSSVEQKPKNLQNEKKKENEAAIAKEFVYLQSLFGEDQYWGIQQSKVTLVDEDKRNLFLHKKYHNDTHTFQVAQPDMYLRMDLSILTFFASDEVEFPNEPAVLFEIKENSYIQLLPCEQYNNQYLEFQKLKIINENIHIDNKQPYIIFLKTQQDQFIKYEYSNRKFIFAVEIKDAQPFIVFEIKQKILIKLIPKMLKKQYIGISNNEIIVLDDKKSKMVNNKYFNLNALSTYRLTLSQKNVFKNLSITPLDVKENNNAQVLTAPPLRINSDDVTLANKIFLLANKNGEPCNLKNEILLQSLSVPQFAIIILEGQLSLIDIHKNDLIQFAQFNLKEEIVLKGDDQFNHQAFQLQQINKSAFKGQSVQVNYQLEFSIKENDFRFQSTFDGQRFYVSVQQQQLEDDISQCITLQNSYKNLENNEYTQLFKFYNIQRKLVISIEDALKDCQSQSIGILWINKENTIYKYFTCIQDENSTNSAPYISLTDQFEENSKVLITANKDQYNIQIGAFFMIQNKGSIELKKEKTDSDNIEWKLLPNSTYLMMGTQYLTCTQQQGIEQKDQTTEKSIINITSFKEIVNQKVCIYQMVMNKYQKFVDANSRIQKGNTVEKLTLCNPHGKPSQSYQITSVDGQQYNERCKVKIQNDGNKSWLSRTEEGNVVFQTDYSPETCDWYISKLGPSYDFFKIGTLTETGMLLNMEYIEDHEVPGQIFRQIMRFVPQDEDKDSQKFLLADVMERKVCRCSDLKNGNYYIYLNTSERSEQLMLEGTEENGEKIIEAIDKEPIRRKQFSIQFVDNLQVSQNQDEYTALIRIKRTITNEWIYRDSTLKSGIQLSKTLGENAMRNSLWMLHFQLQGERPGIFRITNPSKIQILEINKVPTFADNNRDKMQKIQLTFGENQSKFQLYINKYNDLSPITEYNQKCEYQFFNDIETTYNDCLFTLRPVGYPKVNLVNWYDKYIFAEDEKPLMFTIIVSTEKNGIFFKIQQQDTFIARDSDDVAQYCFATQQMFPCSKWKVNITSEGYFEFSNEYRRQNRIIQQYMIFEKEKMYASKEQVLNLTLLKVGNLEENAMLFRIYKNADQLIEEQDDLVGQDLYLKPYLTDNVLLRLIDKKIDGVPVQKIFSDNFRLMDNRKFRIIKPQTEINEYCIIQQQPSKTGYIGSPTEKDSLTLQINYDNSCDKNDQYRWTISCYNYCFQFQNKVTKQYLIIAQDRVKEVRFLIPYHVLTPDSKYLTVPNESNTPGMPILVKQQKINIGQLFCVLRKNRYTIEEIDVVSLRVLHSGMYLTRKPQKIHIIPQDASDKIYNNWIIDTEKVVMLKSKQNKIFYLTIQNNKLILTDQYQKENQEFVLCNKQGEPQVDFAPNEEFNIKYVDSNKVNNIYIGTPIDVNNKEKKDVTECILSEQASTLQVKTDEQWNFWKKILISYKVLCAEDNALRLMDEGASKLPQNLITTLWSIEPANSFDLVINLTQENFQKQSKTDQIKYLQFSEKQNELQVCGFQKNMKSQSQFAFFDSVKKALLQTSISAFQGPIFICLLKNNKFLGQNNKNVCLVSDIKDALPFKVELMNSGIIPIFSFRLYNSQEYLCVNNEKIAINSEKQYYQWQIVSTTYKLINIKQYDNQIITSCFSNSNISIQPTSDEAKYQLFRMKIKETIKQIAENTQAQVETDKYQIVCFRSIYNNKYISSTSNYLYLSKDPQWFNIQKGRSILNFQTNVMSCLKGGYLTTQGTLVDLQRTVEHSNVYFDLQQINVKIQDTQTKLCSVTPQQQHRVDIKVQEAGKYDYNNVVLLKDHQKELWVYYNSQSRQFQLSEKDKSIFQMEKQNNTVAFTLLQQQFLSVAPNTKQNTQEENKNDEYHIELTQRQEKTLDCVNIDDNKANGSLSWEIVEQSVLYLSTQVENGLASLQVGEDKMLKAVHDEPQMTQNKSTLKSYQQMFRATDQIGEPVNDLFENSSATNTEEDNEIIRQFVLLQSIQSTKTYLSFINGKAQFSDLTHALSFKIRKTKQGLYIFERTDDQKQVHNWLGIMHNDVILTQKSQPTIWLVDSCQDDEDYFYFRGPNQRQMGLVPEQCNEQSAILIDEVLEDTWKGRIAAFPRSEVCWGEVVRLQYVLSSGEDPFYLYSGEVDKWLTVENDHFIFADSDKAKRFKIIQTNKQSQKQGQDDNESIEKLVQIQLEDENDKKICVTRGHHIEFSITQEEYIGEAQHWIFKPIDKQNMIFNILNAQNENECITLNDREDNSSLALTIMPKQSNNQNQKFILSNPREENEISENIEGEEEE